MDVDARRVLAFRLAGQHLSAPADGPEAVLRSWAVQDSPPGGAAAAIANRTEAPLPPGGLEAALYEERSLVALYNARTATAVLPGAEAAAFGSALLPTDDAGLKAIVASAVPGRRAGFAAPAALAVAAVADALDGAVLSRDDLHAALRRRLPDELLPWCEGCQSHHARRGLLVMAGLHGVLCVAGRAGRQPAFARTDQWRGWDPPPAAEARAELVRRYLRGYGPSTPSDFTAWAGLGRVHARALWDAVAGELAPVRVDDRPPSWLLAGDVAVLQDPPEARGVRLLAPGDPLLLGRDRELLVPDAAARTAVWRAIGGAGVVLADGRAVATWRARKAGRRLAVTVTGFARVPRRAVAAAAERLAAQRGCAEAAVTWA